MQRLAFTAFKRSSKILYRRMATEAKPAATAAATATAKTAEKVVPKAAAPKEAAAKTATTAASAAQKAAPKQGVPPKNPTPKAPNGGKAPKKGGKGKTITVTTLAVLLGAGGLYRYHANNDHLACINGNKGGSGTNILETLYLAPKDLESKYEEYQFNTYVDRLIYEILHHNPRDFKTMGDVFNFFGQWFTTLGIDVDLKAPVSDSALVEMFSEFSKQENMFNLYIIGERYFGVSPMTDFMAQSASRLFDAQRKKRDGEFFIPMEDVIDFVTTLQEKTKETFYTSAFVPNFADKLFSADARAVKKTTLLEYLKANSDMRMGVYDFVKMMAVIERQNTNKKFYFYVDEYVEIKVNEALFDNRSEEEEEEKVEEKVEEKPEEEVEKPEEKSEEKPEEEAEEKPEEKPEETPVVLPVEAPEETEVVSVDSLLNELQTVTGEKWSKLMTADWEGAKAAREEERKIRSELREQNWW